jgi:endonuclease YncB( thermonuclease family)
MELSKDQLELLNNCKKDKKCFSFAGLKTKAKVVDIYDGDTITVKFFFGNQLIQYKCRLLGIDTPEIKSKDEEKKKLAIKARDRLRELILNKVVELDVREFDKYGRLLGVISCDNQNINELMLKECHGYSYDGGKKNSD